MRPIKYKFSVVVNENNSAKNDEEKYYATAIIEEVHNGRAIGRVEHNLPAYFGKDRLEAHDKMENVARQWIQVNEK
ncbi:MAG: hypothetical protein ABL917_03570 [Parcubacteria group bacterium]